MKNRASKKQLKPVKKNSRWPLIGVVISTLLCVGIVTALSKQSGQTQKAQVGQTQKAQAEERKPVVDKSRKRNYVTLNEAGQAVVLDRQTGQTRQLTPEEALKLAEGIKQLVNQSDEGLIQIEHADGSVSMDLQGRFQNVMLAKKEADGIISQACVDNVESAASFFEIDPVLLGAAAPVSKSVPSTTLPIR